jgi:hypothetical protein
MEGADSLLAQTLLDHRRDSAGFQQHGYFQSLEMGLQLPEGRSVLCRAARSVVQVAGTKNES